LPPDVNNFLWTSLETKNPQTFAGCGFFGLNWILLDLQMVEAAGVEPASENAPLPYLHA
jgi:hypothetical protein